MRVHQGLKPNTPAGRGVQVRGLYLNQPRLQPVIDDDVVAIALEAVLVVVHHRLWDRGGSCQDEGVWSPTLSILSNPSLECGEAWPDPHFARLTD